MRFCLDDVCTIKVEYNHCVEKFLIYMEINGKIIGGYAYEPPVDITKVAKDMHSILKWYEGEE